MYKKDRTNNELVINNITTTPSWCPHKLKLHIRLRKKKDMQFLRRRSVVDQ